MDKFFKGVLLLAALLYSFAGTACAEVITVTGMGRYELMAGNNESPALAKARAEKDALRNAAEQAGVYLESKTEVQLGKLTTDEVRTLCAALLKVKGVSKFSVTPLADDSFCYTCELTAQVDTASITPEKIAELKEDFQRNQHKQDLKKQVDQLEQEQEENTAKYGEAIRQYETEKRARKQQAAQWREAAQKFKAGYAFGSAFEALDNAIAVDPEDAEAYLERGNLFLMFQTYPKALADFDKAIALTPHDATAYAAYGSKGVVYSAMKDYPKAIECYSSLLNGAPNHVRALLSRSACYVNLKEYQKALADVDKVLTIEPQNMMAQKKRQEISAALRDR